MKDTNNAKGRYAEIVDLVRFGRQKLNIFTEKEYYEGHIDPKNGADWNQNKPIDPTPKLDDFKNIVKEYLDWEVAKSLEKVEGGDDTTKK